ncbi:hypothetical protein F5Y16DRAFT_389851 [Xylariaceae sp. FL0255]|nr:hypothetical protein F5Y16DRAFT_389851 [Xylariaceae sp. FL0255]
MDRVPPEILYVVCSFLSVDDLQNVRLVSKALADIGASYMLPEVTFYMDEKELHRLHAISEHPIFSKHVHSLTYFAMALDNVSWREFLIDYKSEVRWDSKLKGRNIQSAHLKPEYDKYLKALHMQDFIMKKELDIDMLREVLKRFPKLTKMTMSAGDKFYEGPFEIRRSKGVDDVLRYDASTTLPPEGVRPLEALLRANMDAKCALKTLRAGFLHWRFFETPVENLTAMFSPLANLTHLHLILCHKFSAGEELSENDDDDIEVDFIMECQRTLAKGGLKHVLRLMPQLQVLTIDILSEECEEQLKAATLRDIFDPGFRLSNLKGLVLAGVSCDREPLMDFLLLHKNTLQKLCLRNITLESTSWRKLLPDIRKNLDLNDVCICDLLYGVVERGGHANDANMAGHVDVWDDVEFWDLDSPIKASTKMRHSINLYCRSNGALYPNELPLSDTIVNRHYGEYVRKQQGDEEDEEEDNWEDVDEENDDDDEYDLDEDYWMDHINDGGFVDPVFNNMWIQTANGPLPFFGGVFPGLEDDDDLPEEEDDEDDDELPDLEEVLDSTF